MVPTWTIWVGNIDFCAFYHGKSRLNHFMGEIHPRNFHIDIMVWKKYFVSNMATFGVYVQFQGNIWLYSFPAITARHRSKKALSQEFRTPISSKRIYKPPVKAQSS